MNETTKSHQNNGDYLREHTVLVVEDQPEERKLLVDMLDELGVSSLAVASGEAGLNLLKNFSVDFMLIDIALGAGITGLEVGYQVKHDPRHKQTPIAAVTAYTPEKLTALEEIGFDGFLGKPYTLSQLKNLLDEYFADDSSFEIVGVIEEDAEDVEHF